MSEAKKVICIDLQGNQHLVGIEQLTYRPSVYAIIIKDNKILLSKQWDGYDFPGGKVELGETIHDALVREVKEETGLEVSVGKIVACENSFYKFLKRDEYAHSILMYYLCDVVGGEISTEFLMPDEKSYVNQAEWLDLSAIETLKFYNTADSPKIIKDALILL